MRWLETPFPAKNVPKTLFLSTIFVFGVWLLVPLLIGNIHLAQFAVSLSAHNIAVIVSQSFGEELVFRVFPILAILILFPNRYDTALLASLVAAFYFGLWHPWAISAKSASDSAESSLPSSISNAVALKVDPFKDLWRVVAFTRPAMYYSLSGQIFLCSSPNYTKTPRTSSRGFSVLQLQIFV